METVHKITHGLFLQYQVGTHNYERVDFLMFANQYHPLEQPEEMRERYRTDLRRHIHLMEMMQPLVMGMECRFAENVIEAQVTRGQASELYEQLLKASTIIIEMTGMLLPMYDKALFSDATYAAIVKASENIAAARFLQLTRLEMWRCTFHFASTRWINQTRCGTNLETIIADFDCCFERCLQEMEAEVQN